MPYGLAAAAPLRLDAITHQLVACSSPEWYQNCIRKAIAKEPTADIQLRVQTNRVVKRACLINACQSYYGDVASLVFRGAQLHDAGWDVIMLVPSAIRPYIPETVAAIWEITGTRIQSLESSIEWNMKLATEVRKLVEQTEECWIPHLFQPACATRNTVAACTKSAPFRLTDWETQHPRVAILWREDRWFPPEYTLSKKIERRLQQLQLSTINRILKSGLRRWSLFRHTHYLSRFARRITKKFPNIEILILGEGQSGRLKHPLIDQRGHEFSDEYDFVKAREISKCQVLISAHGSHLVPVSGSSGSVVQLFPATKWANFYDSTISIPDDPGEALIRCRSIPDTTPVNHLVEIVGSLLEGYPAFHFAYHRDYRNPLDKSRIKQIRDRLNPATVKPPSQ